MKNSYLVLAAVAVLFAACSSDSNDAAERQSLAQNEPMAIGFDTYVNRGTTRAGQYDDINTDAKLQAVNAGFGVFAYYTDNNDYDQFSIPNFMYNQKVTFTAGSGTDPGKWTYEPVKYWPNEYGSTAISEDYDRVTFFAYAPYVKVTASTGKVATDAVNYEAVDATGIVGLSRNSAAGDPLVKYIATFDPAKRVDLLWGVVGSGETSWTTKEASAQTMTEGFPWMNVRRAGGTAQNLKFTFDHALAKLNVTVDAFVDGASASADLAVDNKIFVRSISFTGLATKGALNLNNQDGTAHVAKWYSFNGTSDLETGEEVTIYDGRKDGKEGTAAASTEKVKGLNDVLIESAAWGSTPAGVTKTAVNLFNSTTVDDAIYVIPTGEAVNVTIVYEVEAEDSKLPTFLADGVTHGSKIKNTITKNAVFAKLENGKAYTLKLHLGMNSVKFDAAITDWVSETAVDSNHPAN